MKANHGQSGTIHPNFYKQVQKDSNGNLSMIERLIFFSDIIRYHKRTSEV